MPLWEKKSFFLDKIGFEIKKSCCWWQLSAGWAYQDSTGMIAAYCFWVDFLTSGQLVVDTLDEQIREVNLEWREFEVRRQKTNNLLGVFIVGKIKCNGDNPKCLCSTPV